MNLERVVTQMQRAGFALQIGGEEKLLVSPIDKLTKKQRDFLKANKQDLIKTLSQHQTPKLSNDDLDNIKEHLDERAAIQQFDGGLSQSEAERQAESNMRVFHYRITDYPDSWMVMIAPGCDLDEAKRTVNAKFGNDRVIDIREYNYSLEKSE